MFLSTVAAAVLCFCSAEPSTAERAGELISRLGSSDYRDREAAFRELDSLGEAALERLASARASGDSEVARRAAELIRRIERRTASARMLAPTMVELRIENLPLPEAVREFAAKTSLPVELHGDQSRFADRKVTFECGRVTVWEALAGFTRAANLTEWDGVSPLPGAPATVAQGQFDGLAQPLPAGRIIVRSSGSARQINSPHGHKLLLLDGTPPSVTDHIGGAVRIRILPVGTSLPNLVAGGEELVLPLQVTLEPRLTWAYDRRPAVRIGQATDDAGQLLTANVVGASPVAVQMDELVVFGAMDMPVGRPALVQRRQFVPLRFRKGELPARSLRDVTGVLTLPLRSTGTVAALDNPLTAVGKTVHSANGSMTLNAAERTAAGDVRLEVSLELPPGVESAWPFGGNRAAIAGNVQMRFQNGALVQQLNGAPANLPGGVNDFMGLSLSDADGNRFRAQNVHQQQVTHSGDGTRIRLGLTFRPGKGGHEAARLTFSAVCPETVEVPFTFAEVALQ